jgi:Undecaprenyl-phosphate galactose phosphotransferase WbaP
VKGQTEAVGGDVGTATLSAGVGRGMFNSGVHYATDIAETEQSGEHTQPKSQRAFSRRVGAQYSLQVILNSLPLLIADILAITATIGIFRVIFFKLGVVSVGMDVSECLLPVASGFVLLNFELDLYPGARLSPVEELRRLVVSITCMFVVWAIGAAVAHGSFTMQIWFLIVVYPACLFTLPITRTWTRHLLGRYTRWGLPALVFGDDAAAVRLYYWLADNHHLGLRPVGVVGNREALDAGPDDKWYAGSWSDTQELAEKKGVFWAVVVPPDDRSTSVSSLIADYLFTIPQVHVLSELTGLPDHWNPQQLDGLAGIHLQQNLMLPLPRLTKRCMDFVTAILGGIVLLPFLFYLAVAVKMSSRGPIIYGHTRIGRNGRRFKAWKFRTMFQDSNLVLEQYLEANPDAREEWERDHKLRFDPRITRIGRFLRKTSLDELPQLWNVIWGDMSLVGPRPIVDAEITKYGPYYGFYTMVKPGITGLWQVSGRNNTTYDERVQLDTYYVRNWSPWMDVVLLLKTIRIVLFAKGAY